MNDGQHGLNNARSDQGSRWIEFLWNGGFRAEGLQMFVTAAAMPAND